MSKVKKENLYGLILIILGIGAILVNVKNAFVNYNTDIEYAVTMSYRILKGDGMFLQMWEPHQTSAFLAAFFMQIYIRLFGTTAGVALFLNFVGIVIKALITLFIYFVLKKYVNTKVLYLMCLFFFTVSPKNFVFPEFSNMQLWFSALLFGMLFWYFQNQNKKIGLILAAAALCLEIISYPSCIILYLGVAALLWSYSHSKWRDLLIFSLGCLGFGVAYAGYFVAKIGGKSFAESIGNIIGVDGSHDTSFVDKFATYLTECGKTFLFLAVCLLISAAAAHIYAFVFKKKKKPYMLFFLVVLCIYHFVSAALVGDRYRYLSVFPAIILCGWRACRVCSKNEKMIYNIGAVLSVGALLATLMLTNLTFLTSVAYMILGVMVSFLPVSKYLESQAISVGKSVSLAVLILFCGVTVFRGGFLIIHGDYTNASIFYLLDAPQIIHYGPSKGMVTDYYSGLVINETAEEWPEYVQDGDRILIVTSGYLNSAAYMYADTEIATPSTICTPTYDEKLLKYWELYPEKYPNVVIIAYRDGELKVNGLSYIMQWLENEFQPDEIQDGTFYRYYRKN